MSDCPDANDPVDPASAAAYIADLLADLGTMARSHRFDALAFLIDMACLEAKNLSRPAQGRQPDLISRG